MVTELLSRKETKNLTSFEKSLRIITAKTKKNLPYRIFLTRIEKKEFLAYKALELIYVVKGSVELQTKVGIKKLSKGDFYVVDGNDAYGINCKNKDNILMFLQVDPTYLEAKFGIPNEAIYFNNLDGLKIKENIIYSLGLLYVDSIEIHNEYYYLINRLTDVINNIQPYMVEKTCNKDKKDTIDSIVFDIVEKYSHDVDKNITLKRMAQEYNVSYSYLSRMFKQITGMNFTRYFLNQKLYKALDLLLNTEQNITEVAISCGYADMKALNREFRKIFGMSPTNFRRQNEYMNENIEEYTQNMFYWDSSVQEFFKMVKKEKLKRITEIGIENKNYIIDIGSDVGTNQRTWGSVIDLHCITDDYIENLDNVLRRFNFANIVIKIIFAGGRFLLVIGDEKFRELSKLEITHLIKVLNDNQIIPIIQIDFISQNMEGFFNDGVEFYHECYSAMMEMLELLSATIGISMLSKWYFELYIPQINKLVLDYGFSKIVFKHIDNFVNVLENKFGIDLYKWGLYIGEIDVRFKDEDLAFLKELSKITNQPKLYNIDLIYDDCIIEKKGLSYLEKKLNSIRKEINSYLKLDNNSYEQKIVASLNHIICDSELIEEYGNFYDNLFLNLVLSTIEQKGFYISSYKLSDKKNENSKIRSIFCNEFGIKLPFYYILEFIGELEQDIVWNGDSCVVTKRGNDIIMLLYGDFKECNRYIDNIFEVVKGKKVQKKVVLDIRGLEGRYKITECRLDYENSMFFKEFIAKAGLNSLIEEERTYIQSKTIPEMKINFSSGENRLIYQTELNFLDITLIKLQKVCTRCTNENRK